MIPISRRSHSSHILSLLHFNYPYFAEPGDGLTDEIGTFTWARSGNVKLVGSESPADAIIAGTPKFGYRCLHSDSSSDCIIGTRSTALTMTQFEVSFWIRPTLSSTGNIMLFNNSTTGVLTLIINAERKLSLTSSSLGINFATTTSLALNTWSYVRIQVSTSTASITINNANESAATLPDSATSLTFNKIQLGGFSGQLDEFILRDTFSSGLPTEPEKAVCNALELGGFGIGASGNVTLTANCIMNSVATFTATKGNNSTGYYCTLQGTGRFGDFSAGQEVMIINPRTGEYTFRFIESYGSGRIRFRSDIPTSLTEENTQIIQVGHFNSLTVNAGVTISPLTWNGFGGGIVAFRCKGDCTINGSIITSGKGRPRTDMLQITHSKLIDNFITNTGGGIFITCGGTFTAGSSARLGATWSGEGKGGSYVLKSKGNPGGAGYGGAGGSDTDNPGRGGNGGVGGGGGGGNGFISKDAGVGGNTGGSGTNQYDGDSPGGTQGISIGGNSPSHNWSSGGGGAGGNSGGSLSNGLSNTPEKPYCKGVSSGANVIIIAKTLKLDAAAISTGGEGGNCNFEGTGGGGTGFCYIACERMV